MSLRHFDAFSLIAFAADVFCRDLFSFAGRFSLLLPLLLFSRRCLMPLRVDDGAAALRRARGSACRYALRHVGSRLPPKRDMRGYALSIRHGRYYAFTRASTTVTVNALRSAAVVRIPHVY